MVKNDINTNFENLKAEMMKKRNTAKHIECEEKKSDTDVDVNVNKNSYKEDCSYVDSKDSSQPSISENKIVIKKAKKPQPPKRITYYLKPETIKKIEKYSKITGMGKSELVQTLLDVSLNNLEIE